MKPLTDEMVRILAAVNRGAMVCNEHGRYVIDGEARPDRRSREILVKRGLIEWRWRRGPQRWFITELGSRRLAEAQSTGEHDDRP